MSNVYKILIRFGVAAVILGIVGFSCFMVGVSRTQTAERMRCASDKNILAAEFAQKIAAGQIKAKQTSVPDIKKALYKWAIPK